MKLETRLSHHVPFGPLSLLGTAWLLGSCSSDAHHLFQLRETVNFSASAGCPEGLTDADCQTIDRALTFLRNHSLSNCRTLGNEATSRYEGGKFRYDPTTSYMGYMYFGDNRTWLGSGSLSDNEMANTIAHEEHHHTHSEDMDLGEAQEEAKYWGMSCGEGFEQGPGSEAEF